MDTDTGPAGARRVEGRHDGHCFSVEVRRGAGERARVHEVRVEGMVVASVQPREESGMNAALAAGAALARAWIDALPRGPGTPVPRPAAGVKAAPWRRRGRSGGRLLAPASVPMA